LKPSLLLFCEWLLAARFPKNYCSFTLLGTVRVEELGRIAECTLDFGRFFLWG